MKSKERLMNGLNPTPSESVELNNLSVVTDTPKANLWNERHAPTRLTIRGDDKYNAPKIHNISRLPLIYKAVIVAIVLGLLAILYIALH